MKKRLALYISLLLFAFINVVAQSPRQMGLCWHNYSVDGGATAVFSLFRDSTGRNWVGTTSGLFQFNGYQTYPVSSGTSIFRAQIYGMAEADGTIYVGANDGLFSLDPTALSVEKVEGIFPREIRSLLFMDGTLWIGSLSGLYQYRPSTGVLTGPLSVPAHHAVYCLLQSADGNLYVGSYDGLALYSPLTGEFSSIALPASRTSPGNTFVNSMAEDKTRHLLYIGTEGALLRLDTDTGEISHISACDGNSIKSLAIIDGTPVAGTDNGLFIFTGPDEPKVFRHDSRNPYSIASNVVWALMTDPAGNIWCGTEVGLSIIDLRSPVRVFALADITGHSEGQQVHNIMRDSKGDLWLGGSNGLIRLPSAQGEKPVWYMPGAENGLSHNRVRDITETSDGEIWVATDGGINIFERRNDRFVNHRIYDSCRRLNANWAYGILEDRADSSIWVAGYLGGIFSEKLDRFRSEGHRHTADTVLSTQHGTLSNDLIGQLIQDGEGNKWVVHFRDSSLTRIDRSSYDMSNIPIARITGQEPTIICPASGGGIWCGFYGGVARIEPSGTVCDTIVKFPFGSGDESIKAMGTVGRELWVATSSAVFAIDSEAMTARVLPLPSKAYSSIYYDKERREVILGATDEIVVADPVRLFNEHVNESIGMFRITEGNSLTSTVLDSAKAAIAMPSDPRSIEIDLETASFSPGQYLRFCYRLDDEPQWQLLEEGSNRVRFNTLPSGSHKLHVAIAGVPDSLRTVDISVARPWYRSTAAIAIYILAVILAASAAVREGRRRHRRRIKELERTNALAAVESRLFFLTNISHELKTPLSMIIGPLSKIRTGENGADTAADIETAYENALKLNSLIHQTVEINRMEAGSDSILIYSRIDVVEFCRSIFASYRRSVENRNFVFSAPEEPIYARVDAVKLESLVTNLLSNAVKYTDGGSTIALSVTESDSSFEIAVSDNGVGISESEQSLVFQRLYRSPRTAASHEGTGIGLYLVRSFAELLGGSVSVESKINEGSTFRLTLPKGEASSATNAAPEVPGTDSHDKRKRVLIVDDNRPIADLIASILGDSYNCAIAPDGKAGLTVAASFSPDLIIADEMMPVMTGLEMCRRLKANPAHAATPILLLTAKDSPDIHGESIESGADAFMPKPFKAPVLRAKVDQLLETAERMRRNIRYDTLTAAAPDDKESPAEKQLAEVTAVIENNLSNPELNVEFVCTALDISSKSLYRLLKKYVGVSPVDYIRQTRLRKAAMLLEQKKFSVSEVMYMVGFSSSSYFSKCFSAMFGCTPGQYPGE